VNRLIGILCLFISLNASAQAEANWKSKIRGTVQPLIGEAWTEKILGPAPQPPKPPIFLPQIPRQFKKATSVTNKKVKSVTEYDQLPEKSKRRFNYTFLKELFLATRQTEAKDEDLNNWLNVLDQGGSREGIYQALVLDEVYAALENVEEKPSSRLVDFTSNFLQKFLASTIKRESLEGLNLYSLKRILTEKTLDLMEFYETQDLDALYRWYALVSENLAKNDQSAILKSEIRTNSSPDYHYAWAKAMPIQHIKSEIIVKLHLLMNALQMIQ
jgi:hypothetical protein